VCHGFYVCVNLRFYALSQIIDVIKQGTFWWVGYVEHIGNRVGNPKEEIKNPRNLESNGKYNNNNNNNNLLYAGYLYLYS
jgi:hypothetical protein